MGVAASDSALGRSFSFEGQAYTLKPLTYGQLVHLSIWLEDRAREALHRAINRGNLHPDSLKLLWSAFQQDIAKGVYEPGSELYNETMVRSPAGLRKTLELMLGGLIGAAGLANRICLHPQKAAEANRLMLELNASPFLEHLGLTLTIPPLPEAPPATGTPTTESETSTEPSTPSL